ncbi:sensor domain-containing diguanylate cyclase [Pseudomonas sp. CCI3.2]|uniref:GGDEF domain-containing protein n=1 Tax=unclassified Pseudomonas TaxID=196821 RepID=UPI002AC91393|nr:MULTISPECIES: sensor domain-containing diguanylate cyclase [unclassified Pseudomonas]MEB0078790.1 sensor domain-containing diguanylate cyclase [Pseudomonas sp. MH10out]MEB0089695.1 sensor domain-containing diguanylate cyclase [Pseudomonas sp. CCI4.2]MEB0103562.1 sensor domain-containing diguanylate cyclase [Pseudomonas sp. CCI3.2]MEB0128984.1 sensor domain-containing diguanylate cyclase [Pseudomonas sp. CCI2.4]MEB0160215.1 sensor domain-containing diguanylate cyclase [Pseudomonas sp. AH2 (2
MNSTFPHYASSGNRSRPENILIFGSTLAVIAIVAIVTSLLIRERASARDFAARSASNIVQLIDADVQRNAELYDTSLLGMISAWQRPEVRNLTAAMRQLVLFDRSTAAPYKGELLLLDKNGDTLADSLSIIPRTVNLADRAHFQAHRDNPDLGLLISDPFKLHTGYRDWCISFSRRMSSPTGEFMGVASGAMRLVYFKELFKSLDVGRDSSVSLINTSGFLLARQPETDSTNLVGENFGQRPNFKRFIQEGTGTFISVSSIDSQERLYTFAKVGDLPLIVVVGQSINEVYAIWLRNTWLVGGATGILCIGIFWLTFLLCRELRLRQNAEHELAQLAATDSLTGLANRRRLDQVLKAEWSRGLRSGQPMSLLMIDVDHFKAFNDRHGHHGGDEALRNVAAAILSSIRRPGDLAARYGGEEFCVVLAETPLAGARIIAESIRATIEALPRFANDEQPITVSIGIASQLNQPDDTLASLTSIADKALYQAKRKGRNRVECGIAPIFPVSLTAQLGDSPP